jgi:PD-(D/E)XK endonuclease
MAKPSSPQRRLPASDPKTARRRWNTTKCRGELSEYAFVYKAASLGFGVAKPFSEGERFDFILISRGWPEGEKLWRIQVKSTRAFLGICTE